MIYPPAFEQKLGFDQIRTKLVGYCLSPAGAERVAAMTFGRDSDTIQVLLRQTLELRLILDKGEEFPSRHYFDGSPWLKKIAVEGSYLESEEFLHLGQTLETVLAIHQFLARNREEYPELWRVAESVTITAHTFKNIYEKIDDKAMVRDNASAELARIRKRLRMEETRVRRLADQLFRQAVSDGFVPEGALPTVREGRVVIPIQAEYKRRLRGFILDQSATGQTVFMEPAEMLEVNNEIRDLEHAEKREVVSILRAMTDRLRVDLPDLSHAFEFLANIDFIRAKARFAREIDGELPELTAGPALAWLQAKHPLLYLSLKGKRDVVPLNIHLDSRDRMLLVSGPNAGGKSVCLKTVGLLQYMIQCGLLVPVSERSRFGVFQEIFLDIGDQQSIENDLSTYSSHLRNMAVFLASAGKKSLVLLDELGSGTDPNFGGAIAEAVLEGLLRRGVWGVATTHYYNLKLFAGQREGIRNAAMRFDSEHLQPLYILDIGKPGSSFALEIARTTGLPTEVIEKAEQLVGKDLAGFETLVRNLERERQLLSEKIDRMEHSEAELKDSVQRYEDLNRELESRKKEILARAREEAAGLLRETNREIEKTIRHIRENRAERKETVRVRKNLQELQQRVSQKKADRPEKSRTPIREGDQVRIIGQVGSGTVLALKEKTATVQFGAFKSRVNVEKLEKVSGSPSKKSSPDRPTGMDLHEKRVNFNPVLDMRGKRAEEVIPLLDQFLDTALLLGHGELRIIHGKGEGVLRKIVRDRLVGVESVATFHDEHIERGGDGITVVVLK